MNTKFILYHNFLGDNALNGLHYEFQNSENKILNESNIQLIMKILPK